MDQDGDVPEVRPPTIDDVRRVCRALEEAGARYVVIGGFAVILHGGHRTTKDIDLLVDPTPDNVARLKQALSVLEDDAAREIGLEDLQTYSVVRVADEVMVDLLATACGVTWSEAHSSAERIDLDGTPVIVADRLHPRGPRGPPPRGLAAAGQDRVHPRLHPCRGAADARAGFRACRPFLERWNEYFGC